ncbi:hypothetical protein DRQ09_04960 [candidate division KSB1 bacterium]|nr:MAG: hypothetical protein DRQ09_04960 [candidate division KSB1 bacterium]
MFRKLIIFVITLVLILSIGCKKSSNSSLESPFIVKGVVKVSDEPYSSAMVEFGYRLSTAGTFYDMSKLTDENGEYEFKVILNPANLGRSRYRIRAKNPLTGSWSSYQEGGISLDKPRIHNFYF